MPRVCPFVDFNLGFPLNISTFPRPLLAAFAVAPLLGCAATADAQPVSMKQAPPSLTWHLQSATTTASPLNARAAVAVLGEVTGSAEGTTVSLQRLTGASWKEVAEAAPQDSQFATSTGALAPGSYRFRAVLEDAAGKPVVNGDAQVLRVEKSAQTIALGGPARVAASPTTKKANPALRGKVVRTPAASTVRLQRWTAGKWVQAGSAPVKAARFSVKAAAVPVGTYRYRAVGLDKAGHAVVLSAPRAVKVTAPPAAKAVATPTKASRATTARTAPAAPKPAAPKPAAPKPQATTKPSPKPAPQPAASTGQKINAYVTGYSYWDNDPPGSAEISHPVIHQTAGGMGTYANPITVAVGKKGGSGALLWAAGTRFYVPKLQKYFMVEDSCANCHSGYPSSASTWLDVYVDGSKSGRAASEAAMNALTGVQTVIRNPASNLAVRPGPIS